MPRNAAVPAPDLEEALALMASNNALLTAAVASLVTSQSSFMRSAADADANIGLSISQPLLLSEELAAREIDNTVDDAHRNGLPAADRDHRPSMPSDYVDDPADDDYDGLALVTVLPGVSVTTMPVSEVTTTSPSVTAVWPDDAAVTFT